uniref:Uncharacterized protein n=1 Tax=Ixodes ricinus TaxID=34613 RepID=A0A0K8RJC2_IXORI
MWVLRHIDIHKAKCPSTKYHISHNLGTPCIAHKEPVSLLRCCTVHMLVSIPPKSVPFYRNAFLPKTWIQIDSFETIYQCTCITESFITHSINPSKTLQSHPEWPSLLLPGNLHQTHGSDCTANPCPLLQNNTNCQNAIGASTQTSAEL